jgi:hypothetical protein
MSTLADPAALFARLPPATRDRLQAIGREARDPVGDARDYQNAFDRHVGFLDELVDAGLTHDKLAAVLAAVGIHRGDGTPLTRGTISSALCRARLRAATVQGRAAPAATADPLQDAAVSGDALHPASLTGGLLPRPAAARSVMQEPAAPNRRPGRCARRLTPPSRQPHSDSATDALAPGADLDGTIPEPSDHTAAAANRRAAALLQQLRSKPCP